jgi:hypothetical protein
MYTNDLFHIPLAYVFKASPRRQGAEEVWASVAPSSCPVWRLAVRLGRLGVVEVGKGVGTTPSRGWRTACDVRGRANRLVTGNDAGFPARAKDREAGDFPLARYLCVFTWARPHMCVCERERDHQLNSRQQGLLFSYDLVYVFV